MERYCGLGAAHQLLILCPWKEEFWERAMAGWNGSYVYVRPKYFHVTYLYLEQYLPKTTRENTHQHSNVNLDMARMLEAA